MKLAAAVLGVSLAAAGPGWAATQVTIATVNNSDMITMQKLSSVFEAAHPDIKLNWVVLEEGVLRQRLTTDIATHGGQYDVMTIGLFEAPLWAAQGWTVPLTDLPASYDAADLLPTIRDALSYDGQLHSVPFYAESRLTFYRKDLFQQAGLTMPATPTWAQIGEFAAKLNDPAKGVYGICLRGKPADDTGGQVTAVANSYGGAWVDMNWKPEVSSPAWHEAVSTYTDLLKKYGPPGAASNGYNENLALFASGKCAQWVDATVSAAFLSDPAKSKVADTFGWTHTPYGKFNKGNEVLWVWSLAIPSSSKVQDAAKTFVLWATSKDYIKLVAEKDGLAAIPPGTRRSTYDNPAYLKAAPFAADTLKAIEEANVSDATQQPVPYKGISFMNIPAWPAINAALGENVASVLAGSKTADQALAATQAVAERTLKQAGYPKK